MSNLTTYAANALLDGTAMPTTLYLAGYLGNPGPDALLNAAAEPRRISFTRDAATGGDSVQSSTGSIANAIATETWTHLVLFDASLGGNPWWIAALPSPVSVIATETIRLSSGVIVLSLEIWS